MTFCGKQTQTVTAIMLGISLIRYILSYITLLLFFCVSVLQEVGPCSKLPQWLWMERRQKTVAA